MVKQIICLILAAIAGLASAVSAGTYSGGDGSAADPYQISTPADMNEIGANPQDWGWGKHFVMVNDVNLSDYTGTQFNIIGYYTSYSDNKPFSGVFDGNDHTISNFTYTTTDTDYIGLFGYVDDANTLIKDLTLVAPGVNATGNSDYIGCLVGYLRKGTITSCGIENGSVSGGDDYTGGLVGSNRYGGTISNCYAAASVTGDCYTGGLAGGNGGTIENCYAEGSVMGNRYGIGGLVGLNLKGTISNCYATSSVTGTDTTGGLVGSNYGTISNCHAEGSVDGNDFVGGLIGYNEFCRISNCYAVGSVTGDVDTGGLVGLNDRGAIENCYATGSVSGTDQTGGLVGYNYEGPISNCYSAGSVTGYGKTGGLVGFNESGGTISNCYATGSITGYLGTGGLVGFNENGCTILNCYAAGSVSGTDITGGLVGYDNGGSYTSCFWEQTVNPSLTGIDNIDDPPGVIGESTANMQKADTFVYAAWSIAGNEGVWTIDEGSDYPRLSWQNLPGQPLPSFAELLQGTGSEEQPYLVRTAGQLNLIGILSCEWDKHYKLVADIDLSSYTGTEFNLIGYHHGFYYDDPEDKPFSGVFDGNDNTISNFTYTTTETDYYYIGLFRYVDGPNAVIKNLTLVDPNVNATRSGYVASLVGRLGSGAITGCGVQDGSVTGRYYTGGLVGQNSGTISNCYSAASVTGDCYTGGLAGGNGGTISNCYAEGGVTGDSYTGGLVGHNSGTILNCYAEGNVMGTDWYTGGLVGYNSEGPISNCYAVGSVTGDVDTGGLVGSNRYGGTISASFWDIEIGGPDNGIGTRLPTSQMQTESTFTDAGWDFVEIWNIGENQTYPFLRTYPAGDLNHDKKVNLLDFAVLSEHWLEGVGQ